MHFKHKDSPYVMIIERRDCPYVVHVRRLLFFQDILCLKDDNPNFSGILLTDVFSQKCWHVDWSKAQIVDILASWPKMKQARAELGQAELAIACFN